MAPRKKKSKSKRKKKKSESDKVMDFASGAGTAFAGLNLLGAGIVSIMIIGFGLTFAILGGTEKPMTAEEIERENVIRRRQGKPELSGEQLSRGASIGIGIAIVFLGVIVFVGAVYWYKFVKNNKTVGAVYGGLQGVNMIAGRNRGGGILGGGMLGLL